LLDIHRQKDKMIQYWNSFTSADFEKTAQLIHPSDLEGMKEHLVPVFAQAAKSNNGEIAQLAKLFFGDTSGSKITIDKVTTDHLVKLPCTT